MQKYTVEFINHTSKGTELLEFWELDRNRITRRDYRNIIACLFYSAAESIRYAFLTARVRCEGEDVFTVKCDTKTSASTIRAYVSAARPREKFVPLRAMTVAD